MLNTHSRNYALQCAREDIQRHGRILNITAAILEARGFDVGELERRLLETCRD